MADPEQRNIDWGSADIEDATQHDTEKETKGDEEAQVDQQMTAAFRAFAED
jgi:hypothetical protein